MFTIGEWLKGHRQAAGLSQRELGERLGMTQTGVSGWENGYADVPRRMLARIFEVLSIPEDEQLEALRLPVESSEDMEHAA